MTVRRSRRLQELSNQSTSFEHTPPVRDSSNSQACLLGLSPELRLQIYCYLIVSERPFMIGRYHEDTRNQTRGGPRDFYPGKHTVHRHDRPHRPVQPPISRVCRVLRNEALPIFYQENEFWLIHNEFRKHDAGEATKHWRRFHPWLEQTPSEMFDIMQHVSLCGYTDWPNRIMITVDLKKRQLTAAKEYSTYGDRLEFYEGTSRAIENKLNESSGRDGLSALKAVLAQCDWIYDLWTEHLSAPPGLSRMRKPMEGPEYDW